MQKEAKKRNEAIALFLKGGRQDLVDAEKRELVILQQYLPVMMTEGEVRNVLAPIVSAATIKEFGPLMKVAMAELRGKADGAVVGKLLQEFLA